MSAEAVIGAESLNWQLYGALQPLDCSYESCRVWDVIFCDDARNIKFNFSVHLVDRKSWLLTYAVFLAELAVL